MPHAAPTCSIVQLFTVAAGGRNSGPAVGEPGSLTSRVVVMNNFDKVIRAFDRLTGAPLWNHTVGGPSGGSATIAEGAVFIGSWDKNLYKVIAVSADALIGGGWRAQPWPPAQCR